MSRLAHAIAHARSSSHLDVATFARLAEVDDAQLRRLEAGEAEPAPAELDRCARVLGLRVRDLLAGAAPTAPMTLLFKTAFEGGFLLEELEATGAHQGLGEFMRAVRDAAELEAELQGGPCKLPALRQTTPPTGVFPSEHEASYLRRELQLGNEPIVSMRKLLSERLGIRLFFTTPDELPQEIDGASTSEPRPAILVNLVGGGTCWWRTRMTLAHELAHLLFDSAHRVLFSPHHRFRRRPVNGWRWQLFDGFGDIEVHADAFGACFLAPAEGVHRLVGKHDPTSEAAIGRVGAHFGVGRTVAINRLVDVFDLPHEARVEMESRPRSHYESDFAEDQIEGDAAIRRGDLLQLVTDALIAKKIGKTRACECLGVPLTEPLPIPSLPDALRSPPISPDRSIIAAAQRHLTASYRASDGGRSLHPLRAERLCEHCGEVEGHHVAPREKCPFEATTFKPGGAWQVWVGEGGIGEPTLADAGHLVMDEQGVLIEDHVTPESESPPSK